MTVATVSAAAVVGADASIIATTASVLPGDPELHIEGLPDADRLSVSERIRTGIKHSNPHWWPRSLVQVMLHPADIPKLGHGFDLPITVAVLAAAGVVPADRVTERMLFMAQLGLDGTLLPVNGVLAAALAAAAAQIPVIVVAPGKAAEAAMIHDLEVITAHDLTELVTKLGGRPPGDGPDGGVGRPPVRPPAGPPFPASRRYEHRSPHHIMRRTGQPDPDLRPLPALARRASAASAAGGHHLLVRGGGGQASQITDLVDRLLPPLDPAAELQATIHHSVAGQLDPAAPALRWPPAYRLHPHTGAAGLLGGRSATRLHQPGLAALAHHGVLHLADLARYHHQVLDALTHVLDEGATIVRCGYDRVYFPARFILAATVTSCPCDAQRPAGCRCTPQVKARHLARVTGALVDRFDLTVDLAALSDRPIDWSTGVFDALPVESAADLAARVADARERAAKRLDGTPWRTNAAVPANQVAGVLGLPDDAAGPLAYLEAASALRPRRARQVQRTAWTLADLDDHDVPNTDHVLQALMLNRPGLKLTGDWPPRSYPATTASASPASRAGRV